MTKYECACGGVFPNDVAAHRHRDRQLASDRSHHIISGINASSQNVRPASVSKPEPLRIVPEPAGTRRGHARLEWEDPPPARRRSEASTIPDQILDELRANPGRWAKVLRYTTKTSANSALGRIRKGLYGPGWEAKARRVPDGSVLYLRWIGHTDTDGHSEAS
jgi:hypothetical protein